ncbi:glycosyltransferase family 9 protein [Sphingobacterium sp. SGG-5]|uniref:glycosyltransferase family 9 protein n=1 Tax=Sphingobacterium sp. SGG-5 TaxID=2710881 RepID=UPI0013E9E195|nr:glycosyltransferase family 9 protein [Sphingobacterium sp. SGG-5]NGM63279.1 glycosyltransferase family 9 protein [Sphingobacterium sp. SGG-5]
MKRIIVTRFSAMGDVAMVASVLKEFQSQHTDIEIIVVSRQLFKAFFESIPRIIFHPIDPKRKHRGFLGLVGLFYELKKYKADYVADLHSNIRSKTLNLFFAAAGYKIKALDKGRSDKTAITRTHHKVLKPLRPMTERYADVFRQLGFSVKLSHTLRKEHRLIPNGLLNILASDQKKIGVAPFAQHPYKVFDLTKMEQVIQYLSANNYAVFLFGGGTEERAIAEQWAQKYPGVQSTIGKFSLSQELDIIAHLDLMLSMDSAGMHMASLVGTRCISIWGATHPFAGFLGYGQSMEDCVQVAHPNRPSSVYGNKPCNCDGVEAIDLVSSEMVINYIQHICE